MSRVLYLLSVNEISILRNKIHVFYLFFNFSETTTSPSSSMGSLGPPSPTSRHKYSRSMGDTGYLQMKPSGTKVSLEVQK